MSPLYNFTGVSERSLRLNSYTLIIDSGRSLDKPAFEKPPQLHKDGKDTEHHIPFSTQVGHLYSIGQSPKQVDLEDVHSDFRNINVA